MIYILSYIFYYIVVLYMMYIDILCYIFYYIVVLYMMYIYMIPEHVVKVATQCW